MNADIKKRWLEALRGGEFRQTHGALKDGHGYCCLGVLCELHRRQVEGEWEPRALGDEGDVYMDQDANLPAAVSAWAGLDSPDPSIRATHANTLSQMNDQGYSFTQIADAIEEQL